MILYISMIESGEDKRKFEELYIRYKQTMFYIANRILKDEYLAEDVIVEALEPIVPGYVPEAFSIYEEETHSTRNTIIYRNHKEEEITYSQVTISHSQFIFDTEGVELQYVDIGKQRVTIFTNKGLTQLYWDDEKYMYIITSPIGRHEIIKMAESIIESNK